MPKKERDIIEKRFTTIETRNTCVSELEGRDIVIRITHDDEYSLIEIVDILGLDKSLTIIKNKGELAYNETIK